MSTVLPTENEYLYSIRSQAGQNHFYPRGTVRCMGAAYFSDRKARDYGCLLDVDPTILTWSCLPFVLTNGGYSHVPAFSVKRLGSDELLDLQMPAQGDAEWIEDESTRRGYQYRVVSPEEIGPDVRLANAKDLLRYARWHASLGDRVRLLAGLDENGSLTVAECFGAFQETPPMAGLAALILHRVVYVDLDRGPIGPETVVRRCHGDRS